MISTETMLAVEHDDADLVSETLAGRRDAFRRIVERYQSLICALAYSATGSVSQSEDIAQETFVAAWKELAQLREPSKLRSWLCGIARNLIGKALRREGREPTHAAEPLDAAHQSAAPGPLPADHAISQEEEAILWRSLQCIPEIYREPLVLFYREHKSIEHVAADLNLTEDAVKQRLSRGRKLLREQVAAFVEGALERTNPGKAFTLGVLAALPVFPASAQAAGLGAAAAQAGALAKSGGLIGLFNGLMGFAGMILGAYFGWRLDRDSARSSEERKLITRHYRILAASMAMFVFAFLFLILFGSAALKLHASLMTQLGWPQLDFHPMLLAGLFVTLGVCYLGIGAALTVWLRRSLRRIGAGSAPEGAPAPFRAPLFEYRSRQTLFGWPLVHVRLRGGLERGPVRAWIAGGDAAVGLVFAFGAVAIAPVSFGGLALGVLTLGGAAAGLGTIGGISLGLYAVGGLAIGMQAFGACAIAWTAAEGALAIARDFALGAAAMARHANDAMAEAHIQDQAFFQFALAAMRHLPWLNLLWLLPLVLWLRARRAAS